jgi:dTMP kinase
MRRHQGLFLSFEGTEGSGKSTQVQLLVQRLRELGFKVVENQEPGATAIGKQIRRILLDPANNEMTSMAELLLMFASRAQAASQVILPALNRGEIVVSDRFTDSTLAYQGFARGLGFETVFAIHKVALGSLFPDLTVVLDVDLQTSLARARRRNQETTTGSCETRIDQHALDFHIKVAEGYRAIAALEPERFRIVDGTGPAEQVAERVWCQVRGVVEQ